MAAQQTRTSYRWPLFKSCSKYHDSRPCGLSSVGNATESAFGSVECADESVSSLRCSNVGAAEERATGAGAMKMLFSVFAEAACTRSANRARSLMVKKGKAGRKHER